jgi:hypothetical protein
LVSFHYLTSIATGIKARLEQRKALVSNSEFAVLLSKVSLFNLQPVNVATAIAVSDFTQSDFNLQAMGVATAIASPTLCFP